MEKKNITLLYLFKTFLKIGSVSWGGHLALVSMARKKLSEEDQVISENTVVESVSLASILPGPLAVNIVSYWGYKMRGWKGALVSAIGVLLPAYMALLVLSFLYFKYSHIVAFKAFFMGIMPAVAAIIFATGISMCRKQKPDFTQWIILIVAALSFYFVKGYWASFVLIIAGALVGILFYKRKLPYSIPEKHQVPIKKVSLSLLACIAGALLFYFLCPPSLQAIAKQYVFISLSQVGGGYVVIPSMEKIFVDSLHWLTHQEFVDGIALSQITPGPIFIIAEFVGFKMEGLLGSIVATVSVFFPSALLLITVGMLFGKIQNTTVIKAAFKGIHPVVIGMIFSAAINILGKEQITVTPLILFGIALLVLMKTKISSPLLLLAMGLIGLLLY